MKWICCCCWLVGCAAFGQAPWPVSDSSCASVSLVVCDDLAWSFAPFGGGPPVVRGLGGSPVSVTLLVPSGNYVYSGTTNWTVALGAGRVSYLGVDVRGDLTAYDDGSEERNAIRVQMVLYGFSFYTCIWLGGLTLRMLPRQANVGDV